MFCAYPRGNLEGVKPVLTADEGIRTEVKLKFEPSVSCWRYLQADKVARSQLWISRI